MAAGDHFFIWRTARGVPFQHHAIDLGDGTVVHFTDGTGGVAGPSGNRDSFAILRTPMTDVVPLGHERFYVVRHRNTLPTDQIVSRAISQVGRSGYDLVFDNCEHFAMWCVLDRRESRQISVVYERLTSIGVKTVAASGVKLATKLGVKGMTRTATPWLLVSDAAQFATEAAGHHVGLEDPEKRRHVGRALGGATAVGIGAVGGPAGMLVAGGIWMAGEFAGKVSRYAYEKAQQRRKVKPRTATER